MTISLDVISVESILVTVDSAITVFNVLNGKSCLWSPLAYSVVVPALESASPISVIVPSNGGIGEA